MPFFIVEKSVVMVYNKLLNFAGVLGDPGKAGFVRMKDTETIDKLVAYLKDTYQPDAIIA